ncbi:MAG: hypothetical protein MN733_13480, partial [Nitrososphaera sp.]|nr:hypothetical protein [Nitrososphaera sp.]
MSLRPKWANSPYSYYDTHNRASTAVYAFSGIYPSDPLVSGGLLWWGTPSGIGPDSTQVSGAAEWVPVGYYAGTSPKCIINRRFQNVTDATQPFIASGGAPQPDVPDNNIVLSGYNVLHANALVPRFMPLIDGGGAMNLDGADNDNTVFIVARVDAVSGTAASHIFGVRDNTATALYIINAVGNPTNAFRVAKRDNASVTVDMRI